MTTSSGACAPSSRSTRASRGWVQRDATTYEMQVNLDAQTKYTLSIDKRTDQFEQRIGKAHKVSFETTDASPSLSIESGIYAVEASSEGYPVWSRNVDSFELWCAPVPRRHRAGAERQPRLPAWFEKGDGDVVPWKELASRPSASPSRRPAPRTSGRARASTSPRSAARVSVACTWRSSARSRWRSARRRKARLPVSRARQRHRPRRVAQGGARPRARVGGEPARARSPSRARR